MLSLDDFERLRREICASGPASDGDNLLGMETDFCVYLGDPAYADEGPGLWQNMIVRRHEGARWLITGRAKGRREDAGAIGAELARIWEERLRYQDRAGHAIETAPRVNRKVATKRNQGLGFAELHRRGAGRAAAGAACGWRFWSTVVTCLAGRGQLPRTRQLPVVPCSTGSPATLTSSRC